MVFQLQCLTWRTYNTEGGGCQGFFEKDSALERKGSFEHAQDFQSLVASSAGRDDSEARQGVGLVVSCEL